MFMMTCIDIWVSVMSFDTDIAEQISPFARLTELVLI